MKYSIKQLQRILADGQSAKINKAIKDFISDTKDSLKNVGIKENNGEVVILKATQDGKELYFIASVDDLEDGESFLSSHNQRTENKWGLSKNEVSKYM